MINQLCGDSSNVATYTSQPVAFNGHQSTCGCLTGLRYKPQQKHSYLSTFGIDALVISLVMELPIGNENHCVHMMAFGISGYINDFTLTEKL